MILIGVFGIDIYDAILKALSLTLFNNKYNWDCMIARASLLLCHNLSVSTNKLIKKLPLLYSPFSIEI